MRLEDSVASFQLNSSLVPGHIFNCHLELVLDQSDLGKINDFYLAKFIFCRFNESTNSKGARYLSKITFQHY